MLGCGLAVAMSGQIDCAKADGSFTVLYSFAGAPNDGGNPLGGVIVDSFGNVYGATELGGAGSCSGDTSGCGTIFELTSAGTETLRYAFQGGSDGAYPIGRLMDLGKSDILEGTAWASGQYGYGAVFELKPNGTESVLHAFASGTDGAYPVGPLTRVETDYYGATSAGGMGSCDYEGEAGCGTVFRLEAGKEKVLYAFKGGSDGADPRNTRLVLDAKGDIYGTTMAGGVQSSNCYQGSCGTVFKLTPSGVETVLHAFQSGSDGATPAAGLVMDSSGNLYGTTEFGGSTNCTGGCGTVFKLAPDGTETILHDFTAGSDGFAPDGALLLDGRNLYGTAVAGGSGSSGVVFKLAPGGVETILHSFSGSDGNEPAGDLFLAGGYLYGQPLKAGRRMRTVRTPNAASCTS